MTCLRFHQVVSAALLVCVPTFAHPHPTTGGSLPIADVAGIVARLSAPFSESRRNVEHFMLETSDRMLAFIEQIPANMDKVHKTLEDAITGGVDKINAGRGMLADVEGEADSIVNMLTTMRKECASGVYGLADHTPADQSSAHSGSGNLGPVAGTDHHDNDEFADFLHLSEVELPDQRVIDLDEIIGSIMMQYGADSYVMLEDVLTVMQQVGQHIEDEMLEQLPFRKMRMNAASGHLAEIVHHVVGIASTVDTLQSLASQANHDQIARVGKKVERIGHILGNVECLAE